MSSPSQCSSTDMRRSFLVAPVHFLARQAEAATKDSIRRFVTRSQPKHLCGAVIAECSYRERALVRERRQLAIVREGPARPRPARRIRLISAPPRAFCQSFFLGWL